MDAHVITIEASAAVVVKEAALDEVSHSLGCLMVWQIHADCTEQLVVVPTSLADVGVLSLL